jgi:hypothetical protein
MGSSMTRSGGIHSDYAGIDIFRFDGNGKIVESARGLRDCQDPLTGVWTP